MCQRLRDVGFGPRTARNVSGGIRCSRYIKCMLPSGSKECQFIVKYFLRCNEDMWRGGRVKQKGHMRWRYANNLHIRARKAVAMPRRKHVINQDQSTGLTFPVYPQSSIVPSKEKQIYGVRHDSNIN